MNKLRKARLKAGMTQLELSYLTGVAPQIISQLEHGKIYAYPGWRQRISEALKMDPAELFPKEAAENGKPDRLPG